ncbi:hypothetical protein INT47_003817 [Mucor saturninus]|uniref:BTB domain-containing protein n=1 Tax=Mucor saturninus TaxID=64648 RepID=A0A8H7QLG3_9FUNG|nr:hypothetical protein INT47_003817 [Mucor saturninus]
MATKNSKLERHLMETMFEQSLFSDLSLVFLHPSFPFSMRYNVHKSIMSQSPFLLKLLENMTSIPSTPHLTKTDESSTGIASLTIDLSKALTHCGFILAPFQHIVRRKWQKVSNSPPQTQPNHSNPLLSSHIRFVLQWMYCSNKPEFVKSMADADTLRILSVAVLLDIHDLTQACVHRYTKHQLSLHSIMRDLETICQLPRGHPAYLQLRDAALLLLLRYGPEHAMRLAMLPVDYMADVLAADPLFVSCEFERYCLLKAVLMAFMKSVGKITWTAKGPLDQDAKRLSGFVRPIGNRPDLSATTVRSRKRKRIPSQEFGQPELTPRRLHRLSFTALVPFEKLVADASSGGVIDKATVLSYLLRTTVNYSNMTFDQLSHVRQDGIVDEGIVFRALWQREALERVLFPLTYHHQTQEHEERQDRTPIDLQHDQDRIAALDEYFDVEDSDAQENRRRLLLGVPRFRFRASVFVSSPSVENGWTAEEVGTTTTELSAVFDDGESDGSLWSAAEHVAELGVANNASSQRRSSHTMTTTKPYTLYQKTFYSNPETILGISYRVQIEAQVMPRHRFMIQDEPQEEEEEEEGDELYVDNDVDENIMVCRFELQRDRRQISVPVHRIKKEGAKTPADDPTTVEDTQTVDQSEGIREKTKIHYWIHCLNRHEGILESDRIDPEDRVLVAVTEQRERENGSPGEMEPGYVGQVLVEADLSKGVTVDATVALEIFGFQKV